MSARRGVQEYRDAFKRAVVNALDDLALEIVEVAKVIIASEAIDTGTLLRSDEIREPSELVREVAFTAEHSVYVHYGAEAHWPPLEPIKEWVRRNLSITPTGAELKAGIGEGKPASEVAVERVARAVQAKIAREGTMAVPFLSRAADQVGTRVVSIMESRVNREVG